MRIYKVSGYFTRNETMPITILLNYLTDVLLFFYEVMFINLKIILIALYAASMCGLLPHYCRDKYHDILRIYIKKSS